MRYRPFGVNGQASSALTLSFDRPDAKHADLVAAAVCGLESGVNAFECISDNTVGLTAIGDAIAGLDRTMLLVGLRLPVSTEAGPRDLSRAGIVRVFQDSLKQSGLTWFDYIVIEDPRPGELDSAVFATLEAARQARRLRYIGVSGESSEVDRLIESGEIGLLCVRYNLRSDWAARNRMKQALANRLIVIGSDYHPKVVKTATGYTEASHGRPSRQGFLGLQFFGKPKPSGLERMGAYAFLERFHGWTPDQLCLAYALTEPALASVRICVGDAESVTAMTSVVERELPNGISAQIEMARVIDLG